MENPKEWNHRRKWEDNKIRLKEIRRESVEWIQVAQVRDRWRPL
jgi:hypothetical protein